MDKWWNKQTLLWGAIGLGGVLGVLSAFFLIMSFYHPLVLVNKIANQDVIAYTEWHRNPTVNTNVIATSPLVQSFMYKLPCKLWECDFWGEENAFVLRQHHDKVIPELYLYQPDQGKLNTLWQSISTNGQLSVGDYTLQLKWFDSIAVISPEPLTTVAQVNTVADMSWMHEANISSWSKRWGIGYCSLNCINWFSSDLVTKYKQPLLPAFLQSTVRYIAFTNFTDHTEYQLFFTNQYHHPISSKRDYRQVLLEQEDVISFSGEDLVAKLQMLEGSDQNSGLWQTVESLWTSSNNGQAWWDIVKNLGNYPYNLSIGSNPAQAHLILTIPAKEQANWKSNLAESIKRYAAIVFPKIVTFKLPDGSSGSEYIKNVNLHSTWQKENDSESLTITSSEGKKIVKLYLSTDDDQVSLSLDSPLRISPNPLACFRTTTAVEEVAGIHTPNFPFIIWTTVRQSSTQKVVGDVYFDNLGSSC